MSRESSSVKETLSALCPPEGPGSGTGRGAVRAPLRIHFPTATVSRPGARLSKQDTAAEPTFSVAAEALDNLTFPNCDLSPTTSAQTASSSSSSLSLCPPSPSPRYLVASLDLDPPFPRFLVMGPLLHSLQADLTLSLSDSNTNTNTEFSEDGFIRLSSGVTALSGKAGGGGSVAGYMGLAPPGLSSPHRYVFMLWQQPEGVTAESIREELGFPEEGARLLARVRWDQEAFERRLGLERVVAGNYFVC